MSADSKTTHDMKLTGMAEGVPILHADTFRRQVLTPTSIHTFGAEAVLRLWRLNLPTISFNIGP